jgi:alcohol dehydrogenase (cytochrome c)
LVSVREACAVYSSRTREPVPGAGYTGTGQRLDEVVGSHGAVRALDPVSGDARWNFPIQEGSSATGVLATAGGLVFAAVADGNLIALEAATDNLLWHTRLASASRVHRCPLRVDGTQYVAVSSARFCSPSRCATMSRTALASVNFIQMWNVLLRFTLTG